MAKRLKLRICKVITTTLQSCRSKDPSNLPSNPVPSLNPKSNEPDQFKWQKEENWHVIAKIHHEPRRKIYNSSASSSEEFHFPEKKKKHNRKDKNHKKTKKIISTTSSCNNSEADEETETLVSSSLSCLSTDSSYEFNDKHSKLRPIIESQPFTTNRKHTHKRRANNKKTKRAILRHNALTSFTTTEEADQVPARLSVFKKLIPCTVDGKVKESFAIVKRSKDPYEDFKSSMMDMILEKQMFEQEDLEQLLQCFLSLNSRCYHGVIVEAFAEIWEAIFCSSTGESRSCVDHQIPIVLKS